MAIGWTMSALMLCGLLTASPAHAQDLAEQIARQMSRQGFVDIGIEATLLGRTRITGSRDGGSREIVVNPITGEILRDLWLNAEGRVRAADIDLDADRKTFDSKAEDDTDDVDDKNADATDDSSGKGSGGSPDSDNDNDNDNESGSDSGGNSGQGGEDD